MSAASIDESGAGTLTCCRECGTVQRLPAIPGCDLVECAVCKTTLESRSLRSLDAALACSAAALLLLLAANVQTFLTTSIFGVSRESHLVSSATAMFRDGYPELAIAIGLFVVVFPLLRFGLLTLVLGTLRIGARPAWIGQAFRYANALQTWAMADVFLLGSVVAYARLRTEISVTIDNGAYCFIAAAVLTLMTRAALDKGAVWRAISPDPVAPVDSALTDRAQSASFGCPSCELLVPPKMAGQRCPRCEATLRARKPGSIVRASALALAAALLYLPANLYPFATLPIDYSPLKYTVIEGVIDLFKAGLYGLALLVLVASFIVPLLKLAGLAWCIASVLRASSRNLAAKTRLFVVIEEIGRWSMIDPFVIACFVPIMKYNSLIYGRAEPAAPAFAAVVILTTFAAHAFDPRLMWDAARMKARTA